MRIDLVSEGACPLPIDAVTPRTPSASIKAAKESRPAQADALVVFGFTGDLANKKVFPALYAMVKRGELNVRVIGVASSVLTADEVKQRLRDSLANADGVFLLDVDNILRRLRPTWCWRVTASPSPT